tara:strand:- start:81 stop:233 length:153 start_codon:yes stop_codon:yes gene_type:complete
MPRAKKAVRKTARRKVTDRRSKNYTSVKPIDAFWKRVIDGAKKFLESPFK